MSHSMSRQIPHITIGMIVLNGEPFTSYNLRSIYPWAHQIIVVEGACTAASMVADSKGHSIDGTLELLRRFKAEEDPDNKITIVTAEDEGHPDGFWPGEKHEMSQAYAKRATGNYLWQIDVDEFYHEKDIHSILSYLTAGASMISFPMLSFWGGLDYLENGEFLRNIFASVKRIFAWSPGYRYTNHRPPTIVDAQGNGLHGQWVVSAKELKRKKIFMYHYSMLLPKQVRDKCSYYSRVNWAAFKNMELWAKETYFELKHPFAVCNTLNMSLSWLQEYHGMHPSQILAMVKYIRASQYPTIELRPTDDIARIIRTPQYRLGRFMREVWVWFLFLRNLALSQILKLSLLRRVYRGIKAIFGFGGQHKQQQNIERKYGHIIMRGIPRIQRMLKKVFLWPPRGFVRWGSLRRTEPVSRTFGLDRGQAVDRYYIEKFLQERSPLIQGVVLEIGDNLYTRSFGGPYVKRSEVLHAVAGNSKATIVGDLQTGEGLPAEAFDCVILTQTLQCIYDIRAAVQTVHSCLRPGGVVLATGTGISQISRYDIDRWGEYWRFTTLSAKRMFEDVFGSGTVTVKSYGNVLAATALLQGISANELKFTELNVNDKDYEVVIAIEAVKRKR